MTISYRQATENDLPGLKALAQHSWKQFQPKLSAENWEQLWQSLSNDSTYTELLDTSKCFIATTDTGKIVGMVFLVSSGHPTDIYDKDWCYIRFLTVHPDVVGQGIGRKLTTICIDIARQNNDKWMALHTSEFMDTARCLYESLGFTVLKEIDKRLGKRYWLYRLEL